MSERFECSNYCCYLTPMVLWTLLWGLMCADALEAHDAKVETQEADSMSLTYVFAALAALPWLGLLVVGVSSLNLGACPSVVGSFFSCKGKENEFLIRLDVSDSGSNTSSVHV